jgi:hypothetical protein
MRGLRWACLPLLVWIAVSLLATGSASAGLARGLCHSNTARGSIPGSFAVKACFDGNTLHIYNDLDVALGVAVQGSVGKPKRSEHDLGLAAIATRKVSNDPDLLLPGDELEFPIGSGPAKIKLRGTKLIGFYAEARTFETYIPGKGLGVAQAFTAMMSEINQDAVRYADCMASKSKAHRLGCRPALVASVGVAGGKFIVHGGLSVAKNVLAKALSAIVDSVELMRWAYDQPQQVKQILHSGTIKLSGSGPTAPTPTSPPPSPATTFTRQSPVTSSGAISPGFAVTQTFVDGRCIGGSEVGQAYRCFADHYVFDPCYAVADPVTGDGTGVVCPTSPFSNDLTQITPATGLSLLEPEQFDARYGLVLASGTHCTEAQGAHSAATDGRIIDYYCDDNHTVVLRGLHEDTPLWTADIATTGPDNTVVPAGSEAIVSAVLLEHDVPPANRPVTDAGGATAADLDWYGTRYHEVDCGLQSTVADDSFEEEILVNAVDCTEAGLIVTEWDNGDALEPGWSCTYDAEVTLLCQVAATVDVSDPPTFFEQSHIRAFAVG